jgi:hypothetical protein
MAAIKKIFSTRWDTTEFTTQMLTCGNTPFMKQGWGRKLRGASRNCSTDSANGSDSWGVELISPKLLFFTVCPSHMKQISGAKLPGTKSFRDKD